MTQNWLTEFGYEIGCQIIQPQPPILPQVSASNRVVGGADPAHFTASVPNGINNVPTTITIQARDSTGANVNVGGNSVVVDVNGTNNPAPSPATDNGNGTYTFIYTPLNGAGLDTINITADGITISGSPYSSVINALSPAKSTATLVSSINQKQTINISVQEVDVHGVNMVISVGATCTVTITGANPQTFNLTYSSNGQFTGSYVPNKAGTDTIAITLNGTAIFNSPFALTVVAVFSPALSIAFVPAQVTVGTQAFISIQTKDLNGDNFNSGGATVVVNISGAQTGSAAVTDNNNGTYSATYVTTALGTDTITITANGTAITGSPFTLTVAAPVSANYPNLGTGYTTLYEYNGTTLQPLLDAWVTTGMTSGVVDHYETQVAPQAITVTDFTSWMQSPPGALRTVFPQGFLDSAEPVGFKYWNTPPSAGDTFLEFYQAFRIRLYGNSNGNGTFDFHPVDDKLFYFAYATPVGGRSNHSGIGFIGNGRPGTIGTLLFFASQMNADGSDPGGGAHFFNPNVSSGNFPVGPNSGHLMEVYLKMNTFSGPSNGGATPANSDGTIKVWLNGNLVIWVGPGGGQPGVTGPGVRFRSFENPLGVFVTHYTPVWGGNLGITKLQTDYYDIDHLFGAGKGIA